MQVIVAVGGEDNKLVLRSVECFDPLAHSWRSLSCLPFAVRCVTVACEILSVVLSLYMYVCIILTCWYLCVSIVILILSIARHVVISTLIGFITGTKHFFLQAFTCNLIETSPLILCHPALLTIP